MDPKRWCATGMVVELDWDENGQATAWDLKTDHGRFRFAGSRKATELVGLLGSPVWISGWFTGEETNGLPLVKVDAYELAVDAEPEEERFVT